MKSRKLASVLLLLVGALHRRELSQSQIKQTISIFIQRLDSLTCNILTYGSAQSIISGLIKYANSGSNLRPPTSFLSRCPRDTIVPEELSADYATIEFIKAAARRVVEISLRRTLEILLDALVPNPIQRSNILRFIEFSGIRPLAYIVHHYLGLILDEDFTETRFSLIAANLSEIPVDIVRLVLSSTANNFFQSLCVNPADRPLVDIIISSLLPWVLLDRPLTEPKETVSRSNDEIEDNVVLLSGRPWSFSHDADVIGSFLFDPQSASVDETPVTRRRSREEVDLISNEYSNSVLPETPNSTADEEAEENGTNECVEVLACNPMWLEWKKKSGLQYVQGTIKGRYRKYRRLWKKKISSKGRILCVKKKKAPVMLNCKIEDFWRSRNLQKKGLSGVEYELNLGWYDVENSETSEELQLNGDKEEERDLRKQRKVQVRKALKEEQNIVLLDDDEDFRYEYEDDEMGDGRSEDTDDQIYTSNDEEDQDSKSDNTSQEDEDQSQEDEDQSQEDEDQSQEDEDQSQEDEDQSQEDEDQSQEDEDQSQEYEDSSSCEVTQKSKKDKNDVSYENLVTLNDMKLSKHLGGQPFTQERNPKIRTDLCREHL